MGMGFADMSKIKCELCEKELLRTLAIRLDEKDKYSKRFCSEECKKIYIDVKDTTAWTIR